VDAPKGRRVNETLGLDSKGRGGQGTGHGSYSVVFPVYKNCTDEEAPTTAPGLRYIARAVKKESRPIIERLTRIKAALNAKKKSVLFVPPYPPGAEPDGRFLGGKEMEAAIKDRETKKEAEAEERMARAAARRKEQKKRGPAAPPRVRAERAKRPRDGLERDDSEVIGQGAGETTQGRPKRARRTATKPADDDGDGGDEVDAGDDSDEYVESPTLEAAQADEEEAEMEAPRPPAARRGGRRSGPRSRGAGRGQKR
jgi:hypothetical protein